MQNTAAYVSSDAPAGSCRSPGFATLRGAMQPKHQLGLTPVLT